MLFTVVDPISKLLGDWSIYTNVWSIIFRIFICLVFGGLLGMERSLKHQTAGLRTNIMVCIGSCVAMLVNAFLGEASDTARLGAGVISGIGFIGAGCILVSSRNKVTGVTTAATIWSSGIIGLAVGCGLYTIAAVSTIIIFFTLLLFPRLESFMKNRTRGYELHIELKDVQKLPVLLDYVRGNGIEVKSLSVDSSYANTGLAVYSIFFMSPNVNRISVHSLKDELSALDYVNHVDIIL